MENRKIKKDEKRRNSDNLLSYSTELGDYFNIYHLQQIFCHTQHAEEDEEASVPTHL